MAAKQDYRHKAQNESTLPNYQPPSSLPTPIPGRTREAEISERAGPPTQFLHRPWSENKIKSKISNFQKLTCWLDQHGGHVHGFFLDFLPAALLFDPLTDDAPVGALVAGQGPGHGEAVAVAAHGVQAHVSAVVALLVAGARAQPALVGQAEDTLRGGAVLQLPQQRQVGVQWGRGGGRTAQLKGLAQAQTQALAQGGRWGGGHVQGVGQHWRGDRPSAEPPNPHPSKRQCPFCP